jgi:hypothetical protein
MAQIFVQPKLELNLTFTVTEEEARALDALVGYGDDAFIKAFKESLGSHYMEKHEQGLRSFFVTIRKWMPTILGALDKAKTSFKPFQR